MSNILLLFSNKIHDLNWLNKELWELANKQKLPIHFLSTDSVLGFAAFNELINHWRTSKWWQFKQDGTIYKWWSSEAVMNPCADRWIKHKEYKTLSEEERFKLRLNRLVDTAYSLDKETVCHLFLDDQEDLAFKDVEIPFVIVRHYQLKKCFQFKFELTGNFRCKLPDAHASECRFEEHNCEFCGVQHGTCRYCGTTHGQNHAVFCQYA
jgi:hypothetical protein